MPDAPPDLIDESATTHHAPAHEPPPLGAPATPRNSVQPDQDREGRDHYDAATAEKQEDHRAFPGTFIERDKVIVDMLLGQTPRLYPNLLYDAAGLPRLSPQLMTYLDGPERQSRRVRVLLTAVLQFKERDERGYDMVCAHFLDGLAYSQVASLFNVAKSTAQYVTVRFIEHVTDWVDKEWATLLEQAAYDMGALPDAHAGHDDGDGAAA